MRFDRARRSRRGVSEVIAILLLVLVVVVTVVIVVTFGIGIINDLIAGGVATPLTASGQMVVPGSSNDAGFLTLTLHNSQAKPIQSIQTICPTGFATTVGCVSMMYNNGPIAPASPVPPEGSSVGTGSVASAGGPFQAGNTYSVLLAVTFAGGSEVTLDVSVTAVS